MVELVDTLALGASAFGREGSSPFCRTRELKYEMLIVQVLSRPDERLSIYASILTRYDRHKQANF